MKDFVYWLLRLPNAAFSRSETWASRPVTYPEIAAVCPELALIETHFAEIRGEYLAIRNRLAQVPRYHDVDPLQYELSMSPTDSQNWRVFFLQAMGRKAQANCELCPKTAALIDTVPNVFEAFFSILEGGKSLPAHRSPYWGYLRYHLAIEVPDTGPAPSMRVKDEWLTWHEGKGLLFDDSWEHELINKNPRLRSVLIVDIARPMGPIGHAVNRLATLLMRYTYALWVLRRTAT